MARSSSQKINVPMIIISAVVAAIAWLVIHGLKGVFMVLGSCLGIGIISALFLLVMGLVVILVSKLLGTYRADVVTGERKKTKFWFSMIICTVACLVLMFGFEWLYELNIYKTPQGAGTYVFVVDDSGSTLTTDPNKVRYQAIQSIMQEKDAQAQYAIYSFDDDVRLLQPMQKAGDGVPLIAGKSSGGTAIKAALERVISDYEQGIWEASGGVKVILITDGYATDIFFNSGVDPILKRYQKEKIAVSAVGLGDVDAKLLTRIADKTGGEFIDITQVDQLGEAVKNAASISHGQRDLFSERADYSSSVLHGLMRIVFVGILGILISLAEAFAYGNSSTFWFIVAVGAVKAFAASAFLELGICAMHLPAGFVSLISMTLIGTVVARFGENPRRTGGSRGTSRRIDFDD